MLFERCKSKAIVALHIAIVHPLEDIFGKGYAEPSPQIRLQKAGSGLISLLEGADGNLLLEQRSRSGRGETMPTQPALRGQQAIRSRSAHGKQLTSALLQDVEVFMSHQGFY